MPNIYLTDAQLEQLAHILHNEAENGEDLIAGESRALKDLAEELIRQIGDQDEEVEINTVSS